MTQAKYDISHYQGDTFILAFYMPGNVSTQTALCQLRELPSSASAFLTFTVSMTYNAVDDKTLVQASLTAGQTATMAVGSIYYYDFQLTNSGVVTTYLYGNFSVTAEVSR
jgi:hypothetical protein